MGRAVAVFQNITGLRPIRGGLIRLVNGAGIELRRRMPECTGLQLSGEGLARSCAALHEGRLGGDVWGQFPGTTCRWIYAYCGELACRTHFTGSKDFGCQPDVREHMPKRLLEQFSVSAEVRMTHVIALPGVYRAAGGFYGERHEQACCDVWRTAPSCAG